MKLSEAIRLGAMLKPQGFGEFLFDGRSCALGAAMDAGGIPDDCATVPNLLSRWPLLATAAVPCPECDDKHGSQGDIHDNVTILNDAHQWSRERIADWIESIERAREPQSPAACEAPQADSVSLVSDAEQLISVPK